MPAFRKLRGLRLPGALVRRDTPLSGATHLSRGFLLLLLSSRVPWTVAVPSFPSHLALLPLRLLRGHNAGSQLAWKQQQVADALSRSGGFRTALVNAPSGGAAATPKGSSWAPDRGSSDGASSSGRAAGGASNTSESSDAASNAAAVVEVLPTVGCERQYRYRNKAEFTVARGAGGAAVVGLLSKGAGLGSDEAGGAAGGGFVPVPSCHLQVRAVSVISLPNVLLYVSLLSPLLTASCTCYAARGGRRGFGHGTGVPGGKRKVGAPVRPADRRGACL